MKLPKEKPPGLRGKEAMAYNAICSRLTPYEIARVDEFIFELLRSRRVVRAAVRFVTVETHYGPLERAVVRYLKEEARGKGKA